MTLTNWLISYYKFDEIIWSTAFDSIGSNNGTIDGATPITWKINNWLSFDWVNDGVNLNNTFTSVLNGDFSIWGWININSSPTQWIIFWNFSWTWWSPIFNIERLTSWNLRLCASDDASCIDTWVSISWATGWIFLIIERNKTTPYIKIYINNAEVYSTSTKANQNYTSTANLYLGRDWRVSTTRPFWWNQDEIFIYNRLLTSNEKTLLYNGWKWLQYPFSNWNFFMFN